MRSAGTADAAGGSRSSCCRLFVSWEACAAREMASPSACVACCTWERSARRPQPNLAEILIETISTDVKPVHRVQQRLKARLVADTCPGDLPGAV